MPPLLDEALASAAVQGDYDDTPSTCLGGGLAQPGSMRMEATDHDFIGRPTARCRPAGAPEGRAVALPWPKWGAAFGVG